MSKTNKVDLTLLKKLVGELEASLQTADGLKGAEESHDYIIEMSKSAGLAAGVMSEASMLIIDIHSLVTAVQGGAPAKGGVSETLEKILGGLKGGGSN